MKNKYYHLLGLVVLAVFGLSQSALGQVSSFPYVENFDSQSTCGTSCTSVCTLTAGGWTNSTTDDKDWAVDASGTSSSSTGPTGDNTSGSGNYIYTEASGCYSKVADLISPVFDFSSLTNPTLEFYYHMYGQSMGDIEVSVSTDGGTTWSNPLFTLSGEQQSTQSAAYLKAEVPLCAYAGQSSLMIRITGTTGTNFYSDMAIDDIQVYDASTCFAPSSLTTANESGTSIDLNWSDVCAISYDYVVVPLGSPQTATAIASGNVSSNTANATGLSATTNYDVFVRSNCASGSSAWAGPFTIFSGCLAPLSGTYNVGGSNPDYTTISEALTGLGNCGISSAVTINVAAGTYNEQLVVPNIAGASATNTVTIQGAGASSTIVSYDGTGTTASTIEFNAAKHVTLKDMRIENTYDLGTAFGIHLWNEADSVTIENCDIAVSATATSSSVVGILASGSQTSVSTTGNNANGLLVKDCNISGGYYGIRLYGASSAADENVYNRIENTVVDNASFYGIYMYYQGAPQILGCTVQNIRSTTGGYGIYAGYTPAIEIRKNWVQDLRTYGVYVFGANSSNQPLAGHSFIVNNMVSAAGTGDGIYLSGSDSMNLYYNSLYADADQALWINSSSDEYDVRNNILFSANETPVDLDAAPAGGSIMDYNVLYSGNGSDIMDVSTSSYADLAALQAAALAPNFNTNSLSGDPAFAGAPDLHVQGTVANNVAVVIAGITEDIDGDSRSMTTPDIGADEYTPASCVTVSAFTTIMAYADSARVSWFNPNGSGTVFDVEYGLAGFSPGSGTTITAHPDTALTITGLMPNTAYEYYVTADCGGGDVATLAGPAAFNTTLAAPRVINCTSGTAGALFTEEFDNSTSFTGDIASGNGSWLYDNNTTGSSNTGPSGPQSGSHYTFVETSTGGPDSAVMVSPAIDLSAASQAVELSFWLHAYGAHIGILDVGVSTSASGPFTNVFTYGPGQLQTDETDPWQQVGVNLDAYIGQTIYIAFNYKRGTSFEGDLAIDLVEVNSCLSCLNPSNLASANVTSSSADISWTSSASALGSNIEYGPSGFTPGTGMMMFNVSSPATISGLNPATTYDVYVTDSCGPASLSGSAGPVSVTTLCATYSTPFTESFDATSIPLCWSTYGSDPWLFTTTWPAYGAGSAADHTGNGGSFAGVDGSGAGATNDGTLESPPIDLTGLTNPELEFYVFSNNTDFPGDNATLLVEVWDGSSWTQELSYSGDNPAWVKQTVDLSAYSGTISVRFIIDQTTMTGSAFYNDIMIDDVSVDNAPLCAAPLSLGVDSVNMSMAWLSWSAAAGAVSYELEYDTAGFANGTGMTATTIDDSIQLSGLSAFTLYDAYVRTICGNDTSAWVGPAVINTGYCVPAPSSVDGSGIINVSFGTVNNSTGAEPGNYADYTNLSSSHPAGVAFNIDITYGTGYTYDTWAWIDWNQDLDFLDAGEAIYLGNSTSANPTTLSSSISIPSTATPGNYVMRIGGADFSLGSTPPSDPCYTGSYASFEDYTLNVTAAPTCLPSTNLTVISTTDNSADITWTAGTASNWIIEYGPAGFSPGTGSTFIATNDTTTISGLSAATAYDFYVTDSCAPGDFSISAGPESFFTLACAASATCTYTLDLSDTFGDGWNGNEITIWQGGVPIGTYGSNFTTGNSFPTITVDLCDGLPTDVTLSTLGSFSGEIGFTLTNPLNDVQGQHVASSGLAQGDTLSSFTTDCSACGPLVAPFYESFDGNSTPLCFTQSAGAGGPWFFSTSANSVNCAPLADNTGNSGNYAWMDQSGSDDSVSLELPVIDVSGLTTPYMEFYYAMCGTGYSPINITILEFWDGSNWNVFDTIDVATNGWQKFEDTIPAVLTYNNGLFRMRFRAESGGSSSDFYGDNALDDIRIYEAPACFTPSNLGAVNITSSSADIFWTTGGASNWIVEYGPAGFMSGSGTTINATNDTITLSGLMAATSYDFYVQDSCGPGDVSLQTGPYNFSTACPTSILAPYSTDFENISLGNLAAYENCWTTNVGINPRWESEDASGFNENSSGTGPTVDNTVGVGGTYMFLETSSPSSLGDTNVLYSPAIDISGLSSPMLSFYYHMHGQSMGNLRIWAENSSGTRIALDSIVGQQQLAQTDPWLEKQILLGSLPSGTYRFLFEGVAGSSFYSDMSIDDFAVLEAPSCFASSNLQVISAGNNSATLTWTAGTGTSYDVEYGPAGFTPGTGTIINSTNDTLTITGLMASTAYDFYVTDSCGSNGLAQTAGPASFSTSACALSEQCVYYFDLTDAFGDGWNGGEVTVWQNGVSVATLGSNFGTGNVQNDSLTLCDNLPTYVTLSNAGSWPSEIGIVVIQPNGDTAAVYTASATTAQDDTLASFTTNCSNCGTYVAPFFESFELNSASIACWTNEAVSDTSLAWSLSSGSTGGSITSAYAGNLNAMYISQGPSGAADTTRLVSPVLDLSALVNPQLSFWYAQENWFGDQNFTNVYYRASANDPWTFLWGDNNDVSAWTQAIMSLPNPSSTYQIAIEGINNWGHANVVDSLSITDAALVCSLPDSVQANNITATNADISWVSGTNASSSWIEYGPAGFAPGTGTIINPATSVSTLSGLTPGTLYEACVYDICSSLGDTSMAACVTFATLCAPVNSYPYLEDFEAGVIPPCYSETATGSSYTWRPGAGGTPSTATGPAVDHTTGTGSGTFMFVEASSPAAQGDSAFLWTAEFDMTSLSNPEIVYYYHMYGVDIVNLDFQAFDRSTSSWVSLNNIVGQQQTANGDPWGEARVNLAAYTTDTALQLRFLSVRGASFNGDAALDDIIIRETPPCVDASNLMATNATPNSVSLTWDSDTNIVASEVQYGPVGFSLGSGTTVNATPGGTTVTGLMNGTCYDFYVRDSCSLNTAWIGPVTVCTFSNCSVSTMPSTTVNDTTDCDGGSVSLMATSSTNNDLAWLVDGLVRETGDTYVTDSISFTTPFDVAEYVSTSPTLHLGPLTNIATAGYGNFSNGQWITVYDTVHIDSMTVNHTDDVVAFAQIWDSTYTNVLQRGDTFSTPAGITGDLRVPVNVVLTPGVYFMNVDFLSGAGSLFRATGGAAYPYTLPGLMSIDSTNFSSQVRIYYTFDLGVSKACIGMPAQALGVVPGANAGISDTNLVCATETAANLAGFLGVHDNGGTWVDNDATGALTDSILDATQLSAGNLYHFSYIVGGVNGCAGDTADVYVDVEAAPFGGVDTSAALCVGSGIEILRNYLTGTAFGGTWVDLDGSGALNTSTGVFNTNNASTGTYRVLYVLAGVACPADTTTLTLSLDTAASAGMAVNDTVCDDESMVDLNTFLSATASAGGSWTDLNGTGALTGNIFDATAVVNSSSYDFRYKVMSACGDDSVTVSLFVEDCDVSIREMSTGFINIYPNPTTGLVKVDDDNVRGSISVEVFAGNGQLMINRQYAEGEEIRIDLSEFATGIYTVKVNSSKGLDVKRIMKQ